MSVNIVLDSYKKQKIETNPQEQLMKSMLMRIEVLQNKQMKTYLHNPIAEQKSSNKNVEKIENNLKIVMKSNIENLKMLEQSMKQNWQELASKINSLESKIIRSLKEKEQVFEFLEYRVTSVQSSQKNVTEYMRKLAEHQTQKYSGVDLLQQRIKQVQHIFELKIQKQNDDQKILQSSITLEFERKAKQMREKLQQLIQSSDIKRVNVGEDSNIQQIENKVKYLQIESKQNKRKYSNFEQSLKHTENQMKQYAQKLKVMEKQLKQFRAKAQNEINFNNKQIKHGGIKTQIEQKQRLAVPDQNLSSKKSLPTEMKPPLTAPAKKSILDRRKMSEEQDYQIQIKQKQTDRKSRKFIQNQSEGEDPFQNMGGPGIRGLLRKSKQKDQKAHHPSSLQNNLKRQLPRQNKLGPISHQSSHRGMLGAKSLPPVKADMKNQNKVMQKDESVEEDEEQVYQVDEDGYLIDEEGNYLYDQEGNRVQLSEDQMYSLMEQN